MKFAEIDALEEDNMFNESLNQYACIGKENREVHFENLHMDRNCMFQGTNVFSL